MYCILPEYSEFICPLTKMVFREEAKKHAACVTVRQRSRVGKSECTADWMFGVEAVQSKNHTLSLGVLRRDNVKKRKMDRGIKHRTVIHHRTQRAQLNRRHKWKVASTLEHERILRKQTIFIRMDLLAKARCWCPCTMRPKMDELVTHRRAMDASRWQSQQLHKKIYTRHPLHRSETNVPALGNLDQTHCSKWKQRHVQVVRSVISPNGLVRTFSAQSTRSHRMC